MYKVSYNPLKTATGERWLIYLTLTHLYGLKPVNIFGSLSKTAAEKTPKHSKYSLLHSSVSFLHAPPLPLQMAVQLWHLQGLSHPAVEIQTESL